MTYNRLLIVIALLVCSLHGGCRASVWRVAAEVNAAVLPERYAAAVAMYEKAVAMRQEGQELSSDVFAQAALMFDSLAEDRDGEAPSLRSDPDVLRGAAYSYLFAGDGGRAVLYFRRACFFRPLDAGLRDGLIAAYRLCGIEAGPPEQSRVETAASYLEVVPRGMRKWVLVGAWIGACGVGAWRFAGRRWRAPRWCGFAMLSVAAVAAGSLAPLEYVLSTSRAAVVVSPATVRRSPSEEPASVLRAEPLKPGTETSVIRRVGAWTCIQPATGDVAWVRTGDVRRVFGER